MVGDNPASGVFLGSVFVHPGFDVALEMPAKWKTINTAEAAGALRPTGCGLRPQPHRPWSTMIAAARADGLSRRR